MTVADSIGFLADAPQHIGTLAHWHHSEWKLLYTDWTRAVAEAELVDHATRCTMPTTLIATRRDVLLGSVSLVEVDAEELAHYGGPWLASLYVAPEYRGRKLGAELVKALVAHAASQGVDTLRLFTADHVDYYRRQGWQWQARTDLNRTPVSIMSIQPRRVSA
jgi:predicted N-acetyltransferase YhbS